MSSVARTAATAASPTTRVATAPCLRRGRLLPKVSGRGGAGLACAPRSRSAAGRLFPRGVHTARRDLSDRLSEQGYRLRPAVPHGGGNAAHHCRRSQAPRRHATAVLHSWGSTMTHHPHVHMIVPGGGISLDGTRWVRCKPGFLLPVQVLSRLFR